MTEKAEVKATGGIGAFFFALIPWALGIGATAWLTFAITVHDLREQEAQERAAAHQASRMAHYVGADQKPITKYTIKNIKPDGEVIITRANFDGKTILMYAKNVDARNLDYLSWNWQLVSPDGTVLKQGYTNAATCPIPMQIGQSAECAQNTGETDDRVATVQIWLQESP